MPIRRLAAIVLCAGVVTTLVLVAPTLEAAESVWDALRVPGAVVVLRHSYAPGGFDPPDAKLDDCSTQRNLDESGRAQATRVGEAFTRNGVTVGAVLSSPRCRCLDTARLAFGRVEPWTVLQGSLRDAELRKRLAARISTAAGLRSSWSLTGASSSISPAWTYGWASSSCCALAPVAGIRSRVGSSSSDRIGARQ